MTTAEHCMYLTKFCELLACQCMCYSSGELKFMLGIPARWFDYYNYDVYLNLQGLEPASLS